MPTIFSPVKAKEISCNVLYFVGENEILYNAQDAIFYFKKHFNNGTAILVPNTGHDLMEIKPNYVISKVFDYIKNQK